MNDAYHLGHVHLAAQAAYRNTPAGYDEDYVQQKSDLFVRRCVGAMDDENPQFITRDVIEDIVYAALDSSVEPFFYETLQQDYSHL